MAKTDCPNPWLLVDTLTQTEFAGMMRSGVKPDGQPPRKTYHVTHYKHGSNVPHLLGGRIMLILFGWLIRKSLRDDYSRLKSVLEANQ